MKRLLSLSVGGTKIGGIQSFASTAMTKYDFKPDIITGISAGALATLPLALGKHSQMESILRSLTLDDIFSVKPVKENGKLTFKAIGRAATGNDSLGEMGVCKMLRRLVSEEEFNAFCDNPSSPHVWVMSVDAKSCARIIRKVNNLTYGQWITYTVASASIPGFASPVSVDGYELYDGGLRNASLGAWAMETYTPDHTISVFSRPKDLSSVADPDWDANNILDPFARAFDILMYEISKSNEEDEVKMAKMHNLKLDQGFLPVIMKSVFDTDKKRLNKLYEAGIEQAHLTLKK